jgi:hypothetical protein
MIPIQIFLPQVPLNNHSHPQQASWKITTEPEGPSPWLPSATLTTMKRQDTAKPKACCEATLAETTQQVNAIIGEYCDLPFLYPDPKRMSQTTEVFPTESSENNQLQTEHADRQINLTLSRMGKLS